MTPTPPSSGTDWHQRFARYYADVLRMNAQTSSRSLVALDKLLAKQIACDLGVLGPTLKDCVERDVLVVDVSVDRGEDVIVESDEIDPTDEEAAEPQAVILDARREEVRAARRIHRTQSQDPYNRETVIGGPVLKLEGARSRVIGPLLYWEVAIAYDPALKRVTLTKRAEVPELNTMLFEPFLAEDQDMGETVRAVRPILIEGGAADHLFPKILETISGLFEHLEHISYRRADEAPLRDWVRAAAGEVCRRPVLLNAPRSNAVLLNDLRQIAGLSSIPSSGPLNLLTRPEDSERSDPPPDLPFAFSDTAGGLEPLFFPFESNPAQRRVALMAERARILTVQGPPGTGKSHTIANLVCHMVATGRSVLVTSHQPKAVEVVTELLKPMRGLALSLASGDRQSSRDLQNRLQSLIEDSTLRSDTAAEEVSRGLEALGRLDRELRLLAHRFQELSRREHENWSGFWSYAELSRWNEIEPEDSPLSSDTDAIVECLPRWFELRREISGQYAEVAALISPEGKETAGTVEARIQSNLRDLVDIVRAFQNSPPERIVQSVREVCESTEAGASGARDLVRRLLSWMEQDGWSAVEKSEQAAVTTGGALPLEAWAQAGRAAGEESLTRLLDRSEALLARFEDREQLGNGSLRVSDATDAERANGALLIIETAHRSWIRWHFNPAVRRARRVLTSVLGNPPERAAYPSWSWRIKRAISRFDAEQEAEELAAEVARYLPGGAPAASVRPGYGRAADYLHGLRVMRAQCQLLQLVRTAPVDIWNSLAKAVSTDGTTRFTRKILADVIAVLRAVAGDLDRDFLLRSIAEDTPLSLEWRSRLNPVVADLRSGRISDDSARLIERVEDLLQCAEKYRQVRDYERGDLAALPLTLQRLESELRTDSPTPPWLAEHIREALEAYRLHQLINGSLKADPDDIASVAENLRKGQERRAALIAALVERRLRLRQAKAREQGSSASELLRVRHLLGMQRRLGASLVSLRDDIDYGAVLAACPAWLGTIDDVCRLFPAKTELFDYIIVDEASQCAQPALLPLALRCRHLIVVGDSKQLRPSFGRFLPRASLDALRAKHGLSEHRAGVFAEGDDSLLHFAAYRANQSGFLDEHFRCDPAIIAWSNGRYYNNRLKILTHRRPNAFRPPLAVRELNDADDDTDRKSNMREAEAVVRELRRLTDNPAHANLTIGVISPFRKQADLIQAMIEQEYERDAELIKRHRIIASTADGFQGDERDIILYSFRLGPSSHPGSLSVLEREEERFNVAFSRAKLLAVSFISTPPGRFPSIDGRPGIVRSWLDHSSSVRRGAHLGPADARPDDFDSEFERSVCDRLRERGLQVVTQEPCGPYRIDLVVKDGEGRVLAVECDGSWKEDEFGHLRPEDYQRQDLIERAGWVVHRISGRRYLLDPVGEIDRTVAVLQRQNTDEDRSVLSGEQEVPSSSRAEQPLSAEPAAAAETEAQPATLDAGSESESGEFRAQEPVTDRRLVLGRPVDEIRPLLREIIRWSILGSRVHGSMFDRLMIIDERLTAGAELDEADIAALEFIYRIAVQQGFDPADQ